MEKFIYFSNSTQIVKLMYKINSMHTDWSSLSLVILILMILAQILLHKTKTKKHL